MSRPASDGRLLVFQRLKSQIPPVTRALLCSSFVPVRLPVTLLFIFPVSATPSWEKLKFSEGFFLFLSEKMKSVGSPAGFQMVWFLFKVSMSQAADSFP